MGSRVLGSVDLQAATPGIALGLIIASLAVYATLNAPEEIRSADRLRDEQVQREDRDHCEKFQALSGSDLIASCLADLTKIRRNQRDRLRAEAALIP